MLAYVGTSADPWSAVSGWRALLAARCGLTKGGGCTPLDLVAWDLIVSLCICLFSIFLAYFRAFRPFSPIGFFGRIASVCGGFCGVLAFGDRRALGEVTWDPAGSGTWNPTLAGDPWPRGPALWRHTRSPDWPTRLEDLPGLWAC